MKKQNCFVRISILLCILFITGSAATYSAETTPGPTVEVKGIRITGDGYGTDNDILRPFSWSKGTSLSCLIVIPEGGIITINTEKSSLSSLTDNKGTNLLYGTNPGNSGFDMIPQISKDRKAMLIGINSPNLPVNDATAISASGTLSIMVAHEQKTEILKDVELKIGQKIKMGSVMFEITRLGKPDWGDAPLQVTFRAEGGTSSIASIQFIETDGKALKINEHISKMNQEGKEINEMIYDFPKLIEKVNISTTYWTDMKEVNVPFKVKTSVGLGTGK